MTDQPFKFPALYRTASNLSADSQRFFLLLVKIEYSLLVVAAILSMNFFHTGWYFILPTCVLIASLGILILRDQKKPEQDWYRGRALAESIKTSCWKYCMRAEPFGDADTLAQRRSEFRQFLLEILRANRLIGDRMPADHAADDQITQSMEEIRALPLEERKEYYDEHRIKEQRGWYAKKAGQNKRSSKRWITFSIIAYAVAIVLSLVRILEPEFEFWPIEPIIVLASSFIGWTQIKKFNELASSYTLTAHEIGIIRGKIGEISSEREFSTFVVEAEQAFSREHTQWVARQQHA